MPMMFSLRAAIAVLLLWLAGLYNIERLHEPINLASFVYVLTGVLAASIVCIERIRKLRLVEITVASLTVYVILKWWLGYQFFGSHLPITVTECVVLMVTIALAWKVAQGIDHFVQDARMAASMELGERPMAFEEGEPAMYREVQRARQYDRKVSLAAISLDHHPAAAEFEQLVARSRIEVARRYFESRFAEALMHNTNTSDLVAYQNGEFVVMCPELEGKQLYKLLEEVAADLGLDPLIGIAEFPADELTLSGLVDRARARRQAVEFSDDGDSFCDADEAASSNGEEVIQTALDG